MFDAYTMFINLVVAEALDAYNNKQDYMEILRTRAKQYNLELFHCHLAFNSALKGKL